MKLREVELKTDFFGFGTPTRKLGGDRMDIWLDPGLRSVGVQRDTDDDPFWIPMENVGYYRKAPPERPARPGPGRGHKKGQAASAEEQGEVAMT